MAAPLTVHANSGTPLMWATTLHLFIGNAAIGIAEGLLLAWFFKTSWWKSALTLIAANYVSAWVGGFLVIEALGAVPDITITNLTGWFCVSVLAAFALTLLIEFPFFRLLLRKKTAPLKQTVKATVLINGISYLVLFGLYGAVSETSIMTELKPVPSTELAPSTPCDLYFISADGKQVLKSNLAGTEQEPVCDINGDHRDSQLFAKLDENGKYDLWLQLTAERLNDTNKIVLPDFSDQAVPVTQARRIGSVPSIASPSDWQYHLDWTGGISGKSCSTGSSIHLSLETPFISWTVRNATQIENDCVVFQLGADQICLLNPAEKKVALIARGKSPIATRPKPVSKP